MSENESERAVGLAVVRHPSSAISCNITDGDMAPTSHVNRGGECQVAHLEQCGHGQRHVLSPSTQHGMLMNVPGHLHYMSSETVCVWGL